MGQDNGQDNGPVRSQGPRRKAGGSEPLPNTDRMPDDALKVGAGDSGSIPSADAPRAEKSRADAPRVAAVGAEDRPRESSDKSKQPGEKKSKVVIGSLIVAPLAILGVAGIGLGLVNGNDEPEIGAAETSTTSTTSTTIEPIDWDAAETSASLYCNGAPIHDYDDDWETIRDECVDLVLDEIRSDEERFRAASSSGDIGWIGKAAIESVLGDPEEFLKDHGYTTTTSSSSTRTTTSTYEEPEPTYEEPEPTYEEPATNSGSGSGSSAGIGGNGLPLEWRTIGPYAGLQGCERDSSNSPLGASECYLGSDNLYYYDARVQGS